MVFILTQRFRMTDHKISLETLRTVPPTTQFTSQKPRVFSNIALRTSSLASLLESLNNLQVFIYLCRVCDDLMIEIWKYLQNWP